MIVPNLRNCNWSLQLITSLQLNYKSASDLGQKKYLLAFNEIVVKIIVLWVSNPKNIITYLNQITPLCIAKQYLKNCYTEALCLLMMLKKGHENNHVKWDNIILWELCGYTMPRHEIICRNPVGAKPKLC